MTHFPIRCAFLCNFWSYQLGVGVYVSLLYDTLLLQHSILLVHSTQICAYPQEILPVASDVLSRVRHFFRPLGHRACQKILDYSGRTTSAIMRMVVVVVIAILVMSKWEIVAC